MRRKMLLLCSLLLLILGVWGTFLVSQRVPMQAHAVGASTDWKMFQGDLGHSGYNGAETTLSPSTASHIMAQPLWAHKAGGSISSQVVEANGRLYWGSWDGYEHASNPADGSDYWSFYVGKTTPTNTSCNPKSAGPSGAAMVATVTINGAPTSVVFVSGGNATLYALDAATGKQVWSPPPRLGSSPDNMLWAGPVVYNGSVYVGVASYGDCPLTPGQLVQVNASTGQVQHTYVDVSPGCIGGGIWDTPTIDQATGILYVSTGTYANSCTKPLNQAEGLLALHATDLSLIGFWQVPVSARIVDSDFGSTPTLFQATINGVLHQMVGLVNKNGIYYAFDRSNISAGPIVWPNAPQLSYRGNSFSSSGWDGTRLYAADATTTINGATCAGSLRALDPATGAFLWEDCLASGVQSSIMVTPGLVTIGVGPNIDVVDSATGRLLHTYHDTSGGGARFVSTPTIVNGVLYEGNLDGNLFALGLPTSTTTPTPSPTGTSTTTPTPSPTGTPTGIFQDNFDSYPTGSLPIGAGTNQWSGIHVSGTGFALNVSNTQANSKPNSLQFTMGSGSSGTAWALKKYASSTTTHAARFALYLDPSLTLNGQTISLFQTQNRSNTTNGAVIVGFASDQTLQVKWYDSHGTLQNAATSTRLSAGQWNTLEVDQTNDAVNGSWSLWLNGAQIGGQNGIDTGTLPIDACIAGDKSPSTATMSGSFYEDDVVTATQHIG